MSNGFKQNEKKYLDVSAVSVFRGTAVLRIMIMVVCGSKADG